MMVEMALVLPVMLLLILGGIDLDLMVTAKSAVNYVASQTAQCMVHDAGCTSTVFAQSQATSLGLKGPISASSVPPTPCPALTTFPPPNPPCSRVVTVIYTWTPISPFFATATLTSTATGVQ